MGTASVVLPSGDVLVLTNSHEVKRVSRTSGETVWAWAAEDQTSLVVYNKLVPTEDAVYVVGLAKSIAGLTLHVTALASATGAELASQPLPGNLEGPDVLALSAAGAPPVLAWLDKSVPTSVVLTPALDKKPQKARGEYARLVDVGLGAQGWFVAVTAQDQARVLRQGDDGALKGVWEFEFPVRFSLYHFRYSRY